MTYYSLRFISIYLKGINVGSWLSWIKIKSSKSKDTRKVKNIRWTLISKNYYIGYTLGVFDHFAGYFDIWHNYLAEIPLVKKNQKQWLEVLT